MKKRYKLTIAIAISIFLCLCVIVFPIIRKEVRIVQMHSAYEALDTSLMIRLSFYYDDNGRYPDSLDELTDIVYSDGATPDMLKDFKYLSDGNSCELSYFSDHFDKELKLYMIEGELKWDEDKKDGL